MCEMYFCNVSHVFHHRPTAQPTLHPLPPRGQCWVLVATTVMRNIRVRMVFPRSHLPLSIGRVAGRGGGGGACWQWVGVSRQCHCPFPIPPPPTPGHGAGTTGLYPHTDHTVLYRTFPVPPPLPLSNHVPRSCPWRVRTGTQGRGHSLSARLSSDRLQKGMSPTSEDHSLMCYHATGCVSNHESKPGCELLTTGLSGCSGRGTFKPWDSNPRPWVTPPPMSNECLVQRTLLLGPQFLRIYCSLDKGGGYGNLPFFNAPRGPWAATPLGTEERRVSPPNSDTDYRRGQTAGWANWRIRPQCGSASAPPGTSLPQDASPLSQGPLPLPKSPAAPFPLAQAPAFTGPQHRDVGDRMTSGTGGALHSRHHPQNVWKCGAPPMWPRPCVAPTTSDNCGGEHPCKRHGLGMMEYGVCQGWHGSGGHGGWYAAILSSETEILLPSVSPPHRESTPSNAHPK